MINVKYKPDFESFSISIVEASSKLDSFLSTRCCRMDASEVNSLVVTSSVDNDDLKSLKSFNSVEYSLTLVCFIISTDLI